MATSWSLSFKQLIGIFYNSRNFTSWIAASLGSHQRDYSGNFKTETWLHVRGLPLVLVPEIEFVFKPAALVP